MYDYTHHDKACTYNECQSSKREQWNNNTCISSQFRYVHVSHKKSDQHLSLSVGNPNRVDPLSWFDVAQHWPSLAHNQ